MDYSQFYLINDKDLRDAVIVDFVEDFDDWEVTTGERILPEHTLCYPCMGRTYYDVIVPSRVCPFVVSGKIIDALTENNITGWKATSVRIAGKEDLRYYVLMITGRCGPVDYTKSERIIQKSPGGIDCPYLRGLYFDLDSWDGSDFFMAEDVGFIFTTEKVKKLLVRIKSRNVSFERITDFTGIPFALPEEHLSCVLQGEGDKWSDLVRTIEARAKQERQRYKFSVNGEKP